MSRIGNQPIPVKKTVKIDITGKTVKVSGPKGELEHTVPDTINVTVNDDNIVVSTTSATRRTRALHGLSRSLINNMVQGVDTGFRKDLEIHGIGYRAQMSGEKLVLNLGYSHPVEYPIPEGINITVADNTRIAVEGYDKQRVGQVAATIRQFRKPEPYKGKGIRYAGEFIAMKEGKTV